MIGRALLGMALACVLSAADAAMYKWVDDKGVTHYTEEPPPDRKSTRIEIRSSTPEPAQSAEKWREKEQDQRKQRIEKDQVDVKEKAAADLEAEKRRTRCAQAMRSLQTVQQQRPVFTVNERGEKVFIEDKDRAAELDRARKEFAASCDVK
jgi:hypothetical protein